MDIHIENLTPRQRVFADILWQLNGTEDIERFRSSLPAEFRPDVELVINMILATVLDDITDTALAQDLLDNLR